MKNILRIARPSNNLNQVALMYQQGFNFEVLSRFENHGGFDGIILGHPHSAYHLEFTHHRGTIVDNAPTQDNLLIWYVPNITNNQYLTDKLLNAGFIHVKSYNPYWDLNGKTFEDCDGYRIVLSLDDWAK